MVNFKSLIENENNKKTYSVMFETDDYNEFLEIQDHCRHIIDRNTIKLKELLDDN